MPDESFVLLTGASSGIGREMAIQLSRAHRLILNGRDAERLEATRMACADPDRHLIWARDFEPIDTLAAELAGFLAKHGTKVRFFVHCAGVLNILPLRNTTHRQTLDAFNTNLFSAIELTRILIRKKVNDGQLHAIVFVSSIASKFGARGFTTYCATKGALDAFMKALAVELAPAVRVNSVLPGGVRTPMTASIFQGPDMVARLQKDYPLGVGEAADISHAVEFLLSEKAKWITGHQLVVDGGRTSNITA